MAYPPSTTDRSNGQTIDASHINVINDAVDDIVAELGTDPKGTFSTVMARLNDVDARIGGGSGGGTPPASPLASASPVPAGHTEQTLYEFTSNSTWQADWNAREGRESGTGSNCRAYYRSANVSVDETLGAMRLKSTAEDYLGYKYQSAYVSSKALYPLFGYYEYMFKLPIAAGFWHGMWMNAYGSAANFEIDVFESYMDELPGRLSLNLHRGDYALNDVRSARAITFASTSTATCAYAYADAAWVGKGVSGSAWPSGTTVLSVVPGTSITMSAAPTTATTTASVLTPYSIAMVGNNIGTSTILARDATTSEWSGVSGDSIRYKRHFDFDEPGSPTDGHSDWHKLGINIERVEGALVGGVQGFTVRITWILDDRPVYSWLDTTCNHMSGGRPMFLNHALHTVDYDSVWDIRWQTWIGGNQRARVDSSNANPPAGGSTRQLQPDGYRNDGSNANQWGWNAARTTFTNEKTTALGGAAAGRMIAGFDLWDTSMGGALTDPYNFDMAWVRHSTKDADPTPPARTLLFESADGSDEAALTTSTYDGGGFEGLSGTGARVHDTAYYITATGNTTSVRHNTTAGTEAWMSTNPADAGLATMDPLYGRMYFRFDSSLPPANMYLILAKDNAATTNLLSIRWLSASSTLTLYNGIGGTTIGAGTAVIAAATWYRLEFQFDATNDTAYYKLYNEAGTLLETVGSTSAYTGAAPGHIVWGPVFSANQTYAMWTDCHALDQTTWIGEA